MKALEIRCAGRPAVLVGGAVVPPEALGRKPLALLCYLALAPERRRARAQLAALLWPEQDEPHARHSLNEALRRLRQVVGEDRLATAGDAVALAEDALAVSTSAPADLGVELLDGLAIEGAAAFEEWLAVERGRWGAARAAATVSQGELALGEGRFDAAEHCALAALAADRMAEPAVSLLMRARTLGGNPAGALAAFRDHESALGAIGERPSRALSRLAERVRRGSEDGSAGPEVARLPLVGRPELHAAAFAMLREALAGRPAVLVVSGPPGSGVSRLLEEIARRGALEGAATVPARALEADHATALSGLRQLFRSGLGSAPGVMAVAPGTLAVVAGFTPGLAGRAAPREPRDVAEAALVLAEVLAAAAAEQPVVLVLDDAQYADGATVAALHAAVKGLGGAAVAVAIGVTAADDLASKELHRLLADVGAAVRGDRFALPPLDEGAMHALVTQHAPWVDPDRGLRLARRLAVETAGNPLLAVTLLRALESRTTEGEMLLEWPRSGGTFETPLPAGVPKLVGVAIVARIGELSDDACEVLRAAAVCAPLAEPGLLGALTELPAARLDDALAELERRHFLEFEGRRYRFVAPVLADVVRTASLTGGRRAALRDGAAELLARREDLPARVLRAELLAKREADGAAGLALDAAEAAVLAGAWRLADRALRAAERGGGPADPDQRARLTDLRGRRGSGAAD